MKPHQIHPTSCIFMEPHRGGAIWLTTLMSPWISAVLTVLIHKIISVVRRRAVTPWLTTEGSTVTQPKEAERQATSEQGASEQGGSAQGGSAQLPMPLLLNCSCNYKCSCQCNGNCQGASQLGQNLLELATRGRRGRKSAPDGFDCSNSSAHRPRQKKS